MQPFLQLPSASILPANSGQVPHLCMNSSNNEQSAFFTNSTASESSGPSFDDKYPPILFVAPGGLIYLKNYGWGVATANHPCPLIASLDASQPTAHELCAMLPDTSKAARSLLKSLSCPQYEASNSVLAPPRSANESPTPSDCISISQCCAAASVDEPQTSPGEKHRPEPFPPLPLSPVSVDLCGPRLRTPLFLRYNPRLGEAGFAYAFPYGVQELFVMRRISRGSFALYDLGQRIGGIFLMQCSVGNMYSVSLRNQRMGTVTELRRKRTFGIRRRPPMSFDVQGWRVRTDPFQCSVEMYDGKKDLVLCAELADRRFQEKYNLFIHKRSEMHLALLLFGFIRMRLKL